MTATREACRLQFEYDEKEGRVGVLCTDCEDETISGRFSLLDSVSWIVVRMQLKDEIKKELGVVYRSFLLPDGSKASNHHSEMRLKDFLKTTRMLRAATSHDLVTVTCTDIGGNELWDLSIPTNSIMMDCLSQVAKKCDYDLEAIELIFIDGRVLKPDACTMTVSELFSAEEFITIQGSRKSSWEPSTFSSLERAEIEKAIQMSLAPEEEDPELAKALAASLADTGAPGAQEEQEDPELAKAIAASLADEATDAAPQGDATADGTASIPDRVLQDFRLLDVDKDGSVTLDELRNVLQLLDATRWTDENVNALFGAIDADEAGKFQTIEFLKWTFKQGGESLFTDEQRALLS